MSYVPTWSKVTSVSALWQTVTSRWQTLCYPCWSSSRQWLLGSLSFICAAYRIPLIKPCECAKSNLSPHNHIYQIPYHSLLWVCFSVLFCACSVAILVFHTHAFLKNDRCWSSLASMRMSSPSNRHDWRETFCSIVIRTSSASPPLAISKPTNTTHAHLPTYSTLSAGFSRKSKEAVAGPDIGRPLS